MFVLRLVGSLFLLLATMSLIHDGGLSLVRNKGMLVTPIGQHWYDIAPSSLDRAEQAVRAISPWLWDHVLLTILLYPGWIVFGIAGVVLCYAGRKRKRINIYAN